MTDPIYSNAFNFTSYQDGQVDMRTGQYSATVTLATLRPEGGGTSAKRDVTLTFAMAKTTNDGYGIGWTLNLTSFDINALVLRLSTGEQYKANPLPGVGELLTFQDKKLLNVAVRRTGNTELSVLYADGVMETLTRPTGTGPYRVTRLTYETGESQRMDYTSGGWLARITGEQTGTVLLEATYVSSTISRITTLAPGGQRAATAFTVANGLITSISMPFNAAGAPEQVRSYRYQRFANGMYGITQVRNAMGGQELITYQERGHPFYQGAYIPFATIWERQPQAGQPSIVTRYTYSATRNFTGYPFSGGYTPGTDNLYRNPGPYDYWCKAITIDSSNNQALTSVTTTYNKFHLLVEEKLEQGASTKTTHITYNELPDTPFANQPANLQLASRVVTTFAAGGVSRQETTLITTDGYGNTLAKTEPSGLRMEYEYYPVGGEPGLCPPEPNGLFVRFRKYERALPAGGDGLSRRVDTAYLQAPRIAGAGYFVHPQTDTLSEGAVTRYTLLTDAARPLTYGRLSRLTQELHNLTTTTDFVYGVSGTELEETRTITGADGTTSVSGRRTEPVTDTLIEARSSAGEVIRYAYDAVGRVTSETVAPGTGAKAERRYSYRYSTWSDTGSTPAELQTVDAQGKTYLTRYDGLGRVVSSAELLGATQRPVSALSYDCLGRKVVETTYDQVDGTTLALTTRYTYSDWNDVARTVGPDGSVSLSLHDRAANTMTTGIEGLNTTLTTFNAFAKPVSVEQIDSAGNRLPTLTRGYDGYGRCTRLTDVNGNVTRYTYDGFDRVVRMATEPTDATPSRTVTLDYASGSSADLRTAITVNGTRLGTRAYDGVGRLASESLGEGTTRYTYQGASTQPREKTTPSGLRQTFTYNPDQNAITQITFNGARAADFTYVGASGQLASSGNATAARARGYDGYQFPATDAVTVDGTTATTRFTHSPGGRLTSMAAPTGDTESRSYDSAGRLKQIVNGPCVITHGYDGHGRLVSTTLTHSGQTLTTDITFDGFGREATRSFRLGGALLRTITRSYAVNGNLSQRLTTDGGGATLADERFSYDAYSRLVSYSCAGAEHPRDNLGRAISSQAFTHDALDNMTRCLTTFVDGTSDQADRIYGAANPTRLTEIRTSNPASTRRLTYDANGNLVDDGAGRLFTWDGFDRLVSCSRSGGYSHDAEGRLVAQTAAGATPLHLHYGEEGLISERQGGTSIRYRRDGSLTRGREAGGSAESNLLEAAGGVVGVLTGDGRLASTLYTPYGGAGPAGVDASTPLIHRNRVAFNGERLDAMAGLYHLGQGRRAYCPELMMFLSPDPYAVFGGAGFSAYGYCRGDPVNLTDPSGLLSSGWNLGLAILGFVLAAALVVAAIPTGGASLTGLAVLGLVGASLGAVSATLGLTSAIMTVVDEKNGWDRSETIRNLNIASLAFGVASIVTSGVAAVGSGIQAARTTTYTLKAASEVSSADIALATMNGTNAFGRVTTAGERVVNTLTAGTKTFLGIESRWWATAVGVSNMVLGAYFTTMGSIDLANPAGSSGTNGGANGNGQREATLGSASGSTPSSMQPYEPVVRSFEDAIVSGQSYRQEFERQAGRLRGSFSAELLSGVT